MGLKKRIIQVWRMHQIVRRWSLGVAFEAETSDIPVKFRHNPAILCFLLRQTTLLASSKLKNHPQTQWQHNVHLLFTNSRTAPGHLPSLLFVLTAIESDLSYHINGRTDNINGPRKGDKRQTSTIVTSITTPDHVSLCSAGRGLSSHGHFPINVTDALTSYIEYRETEGFSEWELIHSPLKLWQVSGSGR